MSSTPCDGDVVVVGAPRSGTSLVAQLLAAAGLDFGDDLLPPSPANPRGFLEDLQATDIDDELLAPHVVATGRWAVPEGRLAWVGVPAADARPAASPDQEARMAAVLAGPGRRGLKDPRLVWTLDAWTPVLRPGTAHVAVVRHPDEVAASLRRMWEQDRAYYGPVEVTTQWGLDLWEAAAVRLLERIEVGPWLVVDHADLLSGEAVAALAGFTGLPVTDAAVDGELHRNRRHGRTAPHLLALHDRLRRRARADLDRWADHAA